MHTIILYYKAMCSLQVFKLIREYFSINHSFNVTFFTSILWNSKTWWDTYVCVILTESFLEPCENALYNKSFPYKWNIWSVAWLLYHCDTFIQLNIVKQINEISDFISIHSFQLIIQDIKSTSRINTFMKCENEIESILIL